MEVKLCDHRHKNGRKQTTRARPMEQRSSCSTKQPRACVSIRSFKNDEACETMAPPSAEDLGVDENIIAVIEKQLGIMKEWDE